MLSNIEMQVKNFYFMSDNLNIIHDREKMRFYCIVEDKECFADYRYRKDNENIIVLYHTFVPDEFRGKGIAGALFDEVIKFVEDNNLKVTPICSYAAKIFEKDQYSKYLL